MYYSFHGNINLKKKKKLCRHFVMLFHFKILIYIYLKEFAGNLFSQMLVF